MKGLIYPLAGVTAIIFVLFTAVTLVTALNDARRRRAIRAAEWEPFILLGEDGQAIIGIQLVAHWGKHSEKLMRSKKNETIPEEDVSGRIEAYARAQARAESFNSLNHWGDQ